MPGYLEHYGEGDETREKRTKRLALIFLAAVIVGAVAYFLQLNHRQKARVREFIACLQKSDYKAAHAFWGCTEAKPCDYRFDKFLEDWGPQSKYARISSFSIAKSRKCGSGVIVTVSLGEGREEKLWVDGPDMIVSYSPWPACPPR
ncbi:MAG: hypothetical protein HYR60_14095 [Acidobacteria bacterium]|nr:hypothetical protein [Acidobacteriota bacterium]